MKNEELKDLIYKAALAGGIAFLAEALKRKLSQKGIEKLIGILNEKKTIQQKVDEILL